MLRIQRARGLDRFFLGDLKFLAEVLGSLRHRFELRFRLRQLGVELPRASSPGVFGGTSRRLVGFDFLLQFRQLAVPGLKEFPELPDLLRVRLVRLLRLVHELRAVVLDLSFQLLDRPFPLADLFERPFGVFLPRRRGPSFVRHRGLATGEILFVGIERPLALLQLPLLGLELRPLFLDLCLPRGQVASSAEPLLQVLEFVLEPGGLVLLLVDRALGAGHFRGQDDFLFAELLARGRAFGLSRLQVME